jgi:transmembrane sensor
MTKSVEHEAGLEAAAWHARLQSRSVTNDELERFWEWRSRPGNAQAFETVDAIWSRASKSGDDPRIQDAIRNVGSDFPRRRARINFGRSPGLLATGAVVAVLLLATLMFWLGQPSVYVTDVGETLVVRLDDGSRVTLNTSTKILVRFEKDRRDIELLEGQALFQVAPDPSRPFRVTAAETSVVALGTEFEVLRSDSAVKVTLVEGRISVAPSPNAPPSRLAATGDTLATRGSKVEIGKQDTKVALSWVGGKIDLRDVPLTAAIAEVNRYTHKRIVLDSPADADTRISGVFATGDREAFILAATALLGLEKSEDADGTAYLRRGGKK